MSVNLQSTDPCDKARALAVSRSALYCRNLVQEGTFGRVYKGTMELAGREQEVIIKTVTGIDLRSVVQFLEQCTFRNLTFTYSPSAILFQIEYLLAQARPSLIFLN